MSKNIASDNLTLEPWFFSLLDKSGFNKNLIKVGLPKIYQSVIKEGCDNISSDDLHLMLDLLANTHDNKHVGLTLAENTTMELLGDFGFLLEHCSSIKDFLLTAEKYFPLLYKAANVKLTIDKHKASFIYTDCIPTKHSLVHDNEWTLGFFVLEISARSPSNWTPLKTFFSHKKPKNIKKLQTVFGENILFEQAGNGFEVSLDVLEQPYNLSNSVYMASYKVIADKLMDDLIMKECLESIVRIQIIKNISQQKPSLRSIAQELHMSESTLKRKLKKLNLSFSTLKEEVMIFLAKNLLSDSDMAINQIALLVGYSEHSSFTRAFFRLNEKNPSEFRQMNKT
ncbi:MAG: hypothetical protein COA59_03345 [Colwellia sp.]|jgi:AraC-like DNA-binding protein|nr:MAG: hypothetical protein COA59_03345 [Colwellia sp.]